MTLQFRGNTWFAHFGQTEVCFVSIPNQKFILEHHSQISVCRNEQNFKLRVANNTCTSFRAVMTLWYLVDLQYWCFWLINFWKIYLRKRQTILCVINELLTWLIRQIVYKDNHVTKGQINAMGVKIILQQEKSQNQKGNNLLHCSYPQLYPLKTS